MKDCLHLHHCFLLPESPVMGTLLGPKVQVLDRFLTEGVPIYTSCEIGQPLCYAILLLLTVNALVFVKMCFREVNIEETYIGIFFILMVKALLRQENYSSNQYRQQWTQLSYVLLDNINHWTLKKQKGHWLYLCQDNSSWLLNSLTCLQQRVLGKFDPSPCRFWAVQNHGLANFLFVLLVRLNLVLLYCCARTMT